MFVCCECCVLSGRGLCDELITRPEESYRLRCVAVYDLENLKNEEVMTRVGSQRYSGKKKTPPKRCAREIKSRIVMAVAAFNKDKSLSTIKLDLNVTENPVKCHIWSTALYDALTQTLWKVDQKYLGNFDMWCWRKIEFIRTDGGKVLQRTQGERTTLRRMDTRQANRIGHILGRNYFLKYVIKEKIEGI